MKVIFLDIDGVLNCRKTPNPKKRKCVIDPDLATRLLHVLKATGAKVVLSTSWRHLANNMRVFNGFSVPYIDKLGPGHKSQRRKAILRWLADHPNVSRYAILDDEDELFAGLPLFRTSKNAGLTEDTALDVERYLNGKAPLMPDAQLPP
ncbi:MAG: hypothetical protein JO254_01995 [Pseudolabrys sp.]|nr:hypothetical protein [Pseudolabrys sp.]